MAYGVVLAGLILLGLGLGMCSQPAVEACQELLARFSSGVLPAPWSRRKTAALDCLFPQSAGALPCPLFHLISDSPDQVIAAVRRLGAGQDRGAVPALLLLLSDCVDSQHPGWRDIAESATEALGQIGDRRALPLLLRLENVRGIGIIPVIRQAISQIEPRSSLLRPGRTGLEPPETLLRSARNKDLPHDPALLVRPLEPGAA